MQLTLLGLSLIAVAWAIQFIHSWSKGKSLSVPFVAMYGAGIVALVFDSFAGTFNAAGWLNLVVLLLVVLTLLKIHR